MAGRMPILGQSPMYRDRTLSARFTVNSLDNVTAEESLLGTRPSTPAGDAGGLYWLLRFGGATLMVSRNLRAF
jgi:hypothetical protein